MNIEEELYKELHFEVLVYPYKSTMEIERDKIKKVIDEVRYLRNQLELANKELLAHHE